MKRAAVYFVMLSSAVALAVEISSDSTVANQVILDPQAPDLAFVDENGDPLPLDSNGDPVQTDPAGSTDSTDPTDPADGATPPISPTDSQPVTPPSEPSSSVPTPRPGITVPPGPTTPTTTGSDPTTGSSGPSTTAPTTGSPTTAPTSGSPTTAPTTGSPTTAPTTGSPTTAPTTGDPTTAPTTAPTTDAPTTAPRPNGPTGGGNFPQAQTALIAGNQGSQPGYLQSQSEPHGGTITRVTNTHPTVNRNIYSSSQAFNADESVIYLAKGGMFIDVATGQPLGWTAPGGFSHWSTVDPEIMISASGSSVRLWNAKSGTTVKTIPLPGYSGADFQVRTNPAVTGDKVGVKAIGSDGRWYALGVNLATGNIDIAISFDDYAFSSGGQPEVKSRRASASPSGRYLVLSGFADGEYNKSFILDWNTGALVSETRDNNGVECPGGHGDMALDASGNDVFVGICKGGGAAWSSVFRGQTVVFDMATGDMTGLPNVPPISHYSGRNLGRPGWVYGSAYGKYSSIVGFAIDGSRVEYYAEPQNSGTIDYWAQTQAVPSPSGELVLYVSAWHNTNPKGNAYLLDLSTLN